jgi:hypothetical protein
MPRPARDVTTALVKKGFTRREGRDAYFHLFVGGKKTAIFTKVSQGEREIHDGLLSAMAKQMKLSNRLFGNFVECDLTLSAYLAHLRANNHIPNETQ